mmetsp:Transcript_9195/g.27986  ORF Transcript_9195/g.27986 Transcript_9195/m.27986 type:complete len:236 (+) Transcript_9195:1226-1933(+)
MVHCGRGDARARGLAQRLVRVERRRLVRVLAVPQRPLQRHRYGQHRRRGAITHLGPHPLSHLCVIAGAVLERLPRHLPAECERSFVALLRQELVIVSRVDNDRNILVVLCGGADHPGATNVDVLDAHLERWLGAGCDRLAEGIKIDDDQVDGLDVVRRDGLHVRLVAADREDAAVHCRVQRLNAAVEHLREASHVLNLGAWDACLLDRRCGTAGGDDLIALGSQALDERIQVGLI